MYITTLLCTGVDRPPLEFSPPIPIDIESDLGALVGAAPYAAGSVYGLPTSTLTNVVRRNYEPHKEGWRITGTLSGRFIASGYTEAPGTIDGGNPIIFPPEPISVPFSIDLDSGPPAGHPVERPEFAITQRIVASVSFDEEYISETFFPVGRSPVDGSIKGCFLVTTFTVTAELLPYSWEYLNEYYLEHQITVSSVSRLYEHIGGTEFDFDESVVAQPGANVATQLAGNITGSGSIAVRDPLMITNINWGNQPFFGYTEDFNAPAGLLNPSLTMTCSVHYLPSPDL